MEKSSATKEAIALLKKYRAGQCTPEEIERVDRWFNSYNEDTESLSATDILAVEEATRQILSQTNPVLARTINLKSSFRWYSAAACFLIGLSIAAFFVRQSALQDSIEKNLLFVTANGQRKNITLPDGSVVTLNAASSFRLLGFSKESRNVSLTGEAFFKIAKDKMHPFIIKTGKIQTHVVGTSFDIRAYAEEADISVAVSSGRVQIEKNSRSAEPLGSVMTVNHLFTYHTADGQYTQTVNDASKLKCWLNNQLYFNKATIAEIAKTLQRTYNVKIAVVGSSSTDPHFTVRFEAAKLTQMLEQLSVLTGLTYTQNSRGVILDVSKVK